MTIAVRVNIPRELIEELWTWHYSGYKDAPEAKRKVPFPGACRDKATCLRSEVAYKQSCGSLLALKSLLGIVEDLTDLIRESIEDMEEEVIPVSRHRGIRSLPVEVVGRIIDFVGDNVEPSAFEETMRGFLEIPPFNMAMAGAKNLLKKLWHHQDSVWHGLLPLTPPKSFDIITELHLTTENKYSAEEMRNGLRPLQALKLLEVDCDLHYTDSMAMIYNFQQNQPQAQISSRRITLPNLETLIVSNLKQKGLGPNDDDAFPLTRKAYVPLRMVLESFEAPNLLRIEASLVTEERPLCELQILDQLFGFGVGRRTYAKVKEFILHRLTLQCRTAWARADLDNMFKSLPSLRFLTLGSCDILAYAELSETYLPTNLQYLKLMYGPDLPERWSHIDEGTLPHQLLTNSPSLVNVEVLSSYEQTVLQARKHFPGAQWVTDRSIIDDDAEGDDGDEQVDESDMDSNESE